MTAPMAHVVNDRWEAVIEPTPLGRHEFVVEAWTDRYATWHHKAEVKYAAGQDVALELEEGALLLSTRQGADAAAGVLRDQSIPVGQRLAAAATAEVEDAMAGPAGAGHPTARGTMGLLVD